MEINVTCPERLAEVIKLSIEHQDTSFVDCLKRFSSWMEARKQNNNDWNSYVTLHKDYEPNSFSFGFYAGDGHLIMNGGLLFHGFPGDKDASCAVTFSSKVWQIHT